MKKPENPLIIRRPITILIFDGKNHPKFFHKIVVGGMRIYEEILIKFRYSPKLHWVFITKCIREN